MAVQRRKQQQQHSDDVVAVSDESERSEGNTLSRSVNEDEYDDAASKLKEQPTALPCIGKVLLLVVIVFVVDVVARSAAVKLNDQNGNSTSENLKSIGPSLANMVMGKVNETTTAFLGQLEKRKEASALQTSDTTTATSSSLTTKARIDFDAWDSKCNDFDLGFIQRINNENNPKPFWYVSYPDTIDDQKIRDIVNALSARSGFKSFYASSKRLKKCIHGVGAIDTVACQIIHPVVKSDWPARQKESFSPSIFFGIRNPWTVMSAYNNGKQQRYHKLKGQTPIEIWRRFRDDWFVGVLQEWRDQISEWKKDFEVGLYMPVEHLMDETKGPALLKSMLEMFEKQGFVKIDKDAADSNQQLSCFWYKTVGKEALQKHQDYAYNDYYVDYIPSFTSEQKERFLAEFKSMKEEYKSSDTALVAILEEYEAFVQSVTELDQPASKEEAPSRIRKRL